MNSTNNDAKELFSKCGTCSQTFAFLINREYKHNNPHYEKSVDTLSGGIFREGHQCGMLWGAALATGAEAYRRADNVPEARAMALSAAKELVSNFKNQQHTIKCSEITGVKMNRWSGFLKFMFQTLLTGMEKSKCFEMAEEWAPEAIASGEAGLTNDGPDKPPTYNCASMIAERLGATKEEATMVAGFAGGLGLSGEGCGALAVAVWMKTLQWLREHPGKSAPMFRYSEVSKIIERFKKEAGKSAQCKDICGRDFVSGQDHSSYIENGGCKQLLHALQDSA